MNNRFIVYLVVDEWQYDGGLDILSAHSSRIAAIEKQLEYQDKIRETENRHFETYGVYLTPSLIFSKRLDAIKIKEVDYD